MEKKLKSSIEYDNMSACFSPPLQIYLKWIALFDKNIQSISKISKHNITYLACIFILKTASMIGKTFDTKMLIQSKLSPPIFNITSNNYVTLYQILDILEDNDFIELINEYDDNRFYRFNHYFLLNIVNFITPHVDFKKDIFQKISQYYIDDD
jgi:hypothetical protein